eukprot:COSAG03_NODE_23593_length_278_cov_21.737430_1_plen_45_part_10
MTHHPVRGGRDRSKKHWNVPAVRVFPELSLDAQEAADAARHAVRH